MYGDLLISFQDHNNLKSHLKLTDCMDAYHRKINMKSIHNAELSLKSEFPVTILFNLDVKKLLPERRLISNTETTAGYCFENYHC